MATVARVGKVSPENLVEFVVVIGWGIRRVSLAVAESTDRLPFRRDHYTAR